MSGNQLSLFHRFFDRLYPLIRFYHERVRGNAWFSQVTPTEGIPETLWLGGAPDTPADYAFIVENNINAVMDIRAERSDHVVFFRKNGITYHKVSTPDIGVPDAAQINEAVHWIKNQVLDNRTILVHCAKGRGRSATILAAYLMQEHNMSFEESRSFLTSRRRLTKLETRHQNALETWLKGP